jgi:hypothetical protein
MSKWTKVKAAMFAATAVVAALQFGGCGFLNLNRVMELVAIGSIFD